MSLVTPFKMPTPGGIGLPPGEGGGPIIDFPAPPGGVTLGSAGAPAPPASTSLPGTRGGATSIPFSSSGGILSSIRTDLANQLAAKSNSGQEPSAAPAAPPAAPPSTTTFGPNSDWSNPATVSAYFASRNTTPNGTSPQYWADQWNTWGKNDPNYFYTRLQAADEFGGAGAGGAGNPFSDPATAPWSNLVGQISGNLQQPLNTPDLQPLLDYARQYFQTLQGPAYTPDQMQLYKTAATDPITQQQTQENQNILQNFARRGIGPTSGIEASAELANNRNADALRTSANSNLALQAIGTQKDQLAQALGVGQTLAGILPSVQQTNEQRNLTGVNLLSQIPALADSRLAAANQTMGAGNLNPASLIQLLMQGQQTGQVNSQQFWEQLGKLIGGL